MYYSERDIFEFLLQKIDNLTYIAPEGEEISFSMDNNSGLYDAELELVKGALHKMALELELLEIVSEPNVSEKDSANSENTKNSQGKNTEDYKFVIRINNTQFDRYYRGYTEYNSGLLVSKKNFLTKEDSPFAKKDGMELKYINRKILLNNIIILANPDFNSENDLVCEYLFNNVGRTLSRKDLESSLKKPLIKDLNKIAEQLGFTKDIRKVFLSVSKTNICLKRVSISKEELKNLGLDYIRL